MSEREIIEKRERERVRENEREERGEREREREGERGKVFYICLTTVWITDGSH